MLKVLESRLRTGNKQTKKRKLNQGMVERQCNSEKKRKNEKMLRKISKKEYIVSSRIELL